MSVGLKYSLVCIFVVLLCFVGWCEINYCIKKVNLFRIYVVCDFDRQVMVIENVNEI